MVAALLWLCLSFSWSGVRQSYCSSSLVDEGPTLEETRLFRLPSGRAVTTRRVARVLLTRAKSFDSSSHSSQTPLPFWQIDQLLVTCPISKTLGVFSWEFMVQFVYHFECPYSFSGQ